MSLYVIQDKIGAQVVKLLLIIFISLSVNSGASSQPGACNGLPQDVSSSSFRLGCGEKVQVDSDVLHAALGDPHVDPHVPGAVRVSKGPVQCGTPSSPCLSCTGLQIATDIPHQALNSPLI